MTSGDLVRSRPSPATDTSRRRSSTRSSSSAGHPGRDGSVGMLSRATSSRRRPVVMRSRADESGTTGHEAGTGHEGLLGKGDSGRQGHAQGVPRPSRLSALVELIAGRRRCLRHANWLHTTQPKLAASALSASDTRGAQSLSLKALVTKSTTTPRPSSNANDRAKMMTHFRPPAACSAEGGRSRKRRSSEWSHQDHHVVDEDR